MCSSVKLPHWDIFCAVVDNYGDAGVAWRLARELAQEHGVAVRLYCDRLRTLASIVPAIDASRDVQSVQGVDVRAWSGASGKDAIDAGADVVIDMFGCGLPESLLLAMAQHPRQPVWINVEHLSAEGWVESTHSLTSRHPRLPLVRHFFFPGFSASTAGLLRERDLFFRRDAFQSSDAARALLWERLRLPLPDAGALVVSLFCYANRALTVLADAWAEQSQEVLCIVPPGAAAVALQEWAGGLVLQPGRPFRRRRLTIAAIPFVAQDDYDALLWACDLNFVRGEDSFVRAQWAARPLVWHAYPQAENAHRLKLDAFVARYGEALPAAAADAYRAFSQAWNDVTPMHANLWRDLIDSRAALDVHAREWAQDLERLPEFADSLVKFVSDKV
jgi:uncharacterized repeat protein (TIGR03837 family)